MIRPLGWAQLAGCRPSSFLLEKVVSSQVSADDQPSCCVPWTCIAHMLFENLWRLFRFANHRRFDNELF